MESKRAKTVIVLGADGYLGWPTSLHLSAQGHHVIAADSLVRRRWDRKGGTGSLVPIRSMPERVRRWREVTGRQILWQRADLLDAAGLSALIRDHRPDAIVHFAEQRSAPFSMIDRYHAALTQYNNVIGTLNLLFAMREYAPQAHLIKLGTMGEYGTPGIAIEEGFITIEHEGRSDRLPFPKLPGSFYHLSKVHDSHNIHFACRTWGLRSTDLNQGVVYGATSDEIGDDPDLATRFDYDAVWGTVLNRFCTQAALGRPLSVYGRGGQTRGILDLRDTLACIRITLDNPAGPGEYRVFNQFTEQFSVLELAHKVEEARAAHGLETQIDHVPNPRVELEDHFYSAKHQALLDLGLEPHLLGSTLIESVITTVERRRRRIRPELLGAPDVDWREGRRSPQGRAFRPRLLEGGEVGAEAQAEENAEGGPAS
ncbi:MAG TPA: NAD-dependent epimerase/dehydratase family protein [Candidatus Nitrosotalea sp.]|nr:NAD-dependent epimerase/dehydratase family protein [Candidatus Nitrosotalea sp.]